MKKIHGNVKEIDNVRATSSDTTKKFVLITGDSFAAVAYPGISEWLSLNGYESFLLSNDACAPYIYGNNIRKEECKQKTRKVLSVTCKIRHKIHSIIFISNIGLYYRVYGKNFMDIIDNTFRYYHSFQIPVYFVLSNPFLEKHPCTYIPRPFNIKPKNPPFIDKAIYEKQKVFFPIVYEVAKKYSNIHILNPESVFCDDKYCYVIKNDRLLYYNLAHISTDGSYFLGEFIVKEILKSQNN